MRSEGPVAKNQIANPEMIIPAPENVYKAEIEMVIYEIEKATTPTNHYNNIPKCTWADVGRYALDHR